MGWGTGNLGGGSGGLNFKIVSYATESELLADTPKENTIGVITTTPITGWYFAAEQPENMVNGDVWFPTGTSSHVAFNALKKNAVQVYPLSAKQMVSGALVEKTAKSYQGGKWVDWWSGELYDHGNEYTNITGGWYMPRNINGTLTKNADNMVFASLDKHEASSIAMNNGLNVKYDQFAKVNIKISSFVAKSSASNIVAVFRTSVDHNSSTEISRVTHTGGISEETVLSLPIPNAAVKTLLVYVYYGTATIEEIRME